MRKYDRADPETQFDEFRNLFIGDMIMELWPSLLKESEALNEEDTVRTLAEDVIVGLCKKGVQRDRFKFSGFDTHVRLDRLKYRIRKQLFQTRVEPVVRTSEISYAPVSCTRLNKVQMVEFMMEFDGMASMAIRTADDALFSIKMDNVRKGILRVNIEAIFNDVLAPVGYRIEGLHFTGREDYEKAVMHTATAEGEIEVISCMPEEAEERIRLLRTKTDHDKYQTL